MTRTATKPSRAAGARTGRTTNSTPNAEEKPRTSEKARPSLPARLLSEFPEGASLVETIRHLEREIASLESLMRPRESADPITVARAYVLLHFLHACMELTAKRWAQMFERWKTEVVPGAFERDGVTHVPLAEGFRVGVSSPLRASIRAGMRDDAYAWLKANGLGDLIVGTVNASTLSATAKSLLEDENRDLPEDLFNVAFVPGASVTRTKK